MQIDPRLNTIDDCLYRVATKGIIMHAEKVLLVNEIPDLWWGFPGGGVDHGETLNSSLVREIEEEIGVPATSIVCNFRVVHYDIGQVVNGVPRMNVFFRVSIPKEQIKKTIQVKEWAWFTKKEFLKLDINPSYKDRSKLAEIIFDT